MTEHSHQEQSLVSNIIILVGLLFLGYFGLAGLILVDELVFRTFYIHRHSPEWLIGMLEIVYAPLIWLVQNF